MAYCCVCGKEAEKDHGSLLVYGKPIPICASCGQMIDDLESLQQSDPKRGKIYNTLQGQMLNAGSDSAVIDTIDGIFRGAVNWDMRNFNNSIQAEEADEKRENEESEEEQSPELLEDSTSEGSISSHSSFLSLFAVIFLILAIIMFLVIGFSLTRYEPATGWSIIIGGVLFSILTYSVIMLYLSVAKTIANISNKLDETNEQIASTNKAINRLADIITSEAKKQKK